MADRYYYSEPFATNLKHLLLECENIQIAKQNGTYVPPNPKKEKQQAYANKAMSKKPPSQAQLKYLSRLGYDGSPPDSMSAASKLIEIYKEKEL